MQNETALQFRHRAEGLVGILLENEPMSKHTSFRIGGPARFFAEADSAEAVGSLQTLCRELDIPLFILGNGSNLLVSDDGFDGVVLHLSGALAACRREGNCLIVGGGMSLMALTRFAQNEGLSGLEFAYGIPGSVGGAAFMNAGAYGGEMKDVLTSALCLMPDGSLRTFSAAEMDLRYRHSAFEENNAVVLQVTVTLVPDNPAQITARMDDFMQRRRSKQPLEFPSAGSMFKRPVGFFAAALIDDCGLKGVSFGGAQVSPKHAGFVVNTGNATCAEVQALVQHIQAVVLGIKGVQLECEVRRLGW